jgi:nucleoside-diphosphate-sugar epimerase
MRCLITGASGFLGRVATAHLLRHGWEVAVVGRHPVPGVPGITVDLSHEAFPIAGPPPDAVYHLAGRAHVLPRTAREREDMLRVNVQGTRNLLASLDRRDCVPRAVIFASSVSVYGRREGELLDETTETRPIDVYGTSKKLAEELLREWCDPRKVALTVLRLPLLVGPGAPGTLGRMVKAVVSNRYLGVGTGQTRVSMVMAGDVAGLLPRLPGHAGIYHLTDGYHPSFLELETALARAAGRRPPWRLPLGLARAGAVLGDLVQAVTRRPMPLNTGVIRKMTSTLTFSDARSRQDLGWRPGRVLDQVSVVLDRSAPETSGDSRRPPIESAPSLIDGTAASVGANPRLDAR